MISNDDDTSNKMKSKNSLLGLTEWIGQVQFYQGFG